MNGRQSITLFALSVFALTSCRTGVSVPVAVNESSAPCSVSGTYFPPLTEQRTGGLHFGSDQAEWETNYLKHMGEPSLYICGTASAEPEYRFLWDRSLSEPISVRLMVHADGSGTLFVRMLEHGGMLPPVEPGKKEMTWDEWLKLKLDRRIDLTVAQVQHVLDLFSQIEFRAGTQKTPGETTDGSDWIFESHVAGRYKLIDYRNEPSRAARECGLFMVLELGKVPVPAGAIY
jgi:hypothetical protein